MEENKAKIEALCKQAAAGKLTAEQLYNRLSELSETVEDDLVCIIEDCLMELDMLGGSKRQGKYSAKECAEMVLEELKNV